MMQRFHFQFFGWLLLGLFTGAPLALVAQPAVPAWQWATHGGGTLATVPGSPGPSTRTEFPDQITTDAQHNAYVFGMFAGTTRFGSFTLTSPTIIGSNGLDKGDLYLIKYGPTGTAQWAIQTQGASALPGATVTDAAGNTFVSFSVWGLWTNGFTFGPVNVPPASANGYNNVFVAKCSPTGAVLWVRRMNLRLPALGYSLNGLAVDAHERVVLSANVRGQVIAGSDTLAPTTTDPYDVDILVAKFDSTHARQWIKRMGGPDQQFSGGGVVFDTAGNVFVSGYFRNNAQFGSVRLRSTWLSSYVLKLGANGAVQWGRSVVGYYFEAFDPGRQVAVDAGGNSYLHWSFEDASVLVSPTITLTHPNAAAGAGSMGKCAAIVKYDAAGTAQWARSVRTPARQGSGSSHASIAADSLGNCYVVGQFSDSLTFAGQRFASLGGADMYVLKYNTAGAEQWAQVAQGSGTSQIGFDIAADRYGDCVVLGKLNGTTLFDNMIVNSYGGEDVLIGKLTDESSELGGRIFQDQNGNGQRNPGDFPIMKPLVLEVQPGPFYLTANDGVYGAAVQPGAYAISLPNPPMHYNITTATPQLAFLTAIGQRDTSRHFGLRPVTNVNDLRVTLTPVWSHVPNANNRYRLTCTNQGTTALAGTLAFTPDAQLAFRGSAPVPPTSTSGSVLTWVMGTLLPFQSYSVDIDVWLDSTAQSGDMIRCVAVATPIGVTDATPADNTDISTLLVLSSFDPNDKQVTPTVLDPTQVANGEWLTYTVRFQNTGNAPASRVIIRDTLDARLQRATIEVLASSHNMQWQLKGVGVAEFRFPGINLPDSTSNELASHGFVKYRVRARPTLAVGDSVPNKAYIYFDFNAAVLTNTAVTHVRLLLPTGVAASAQLPLALFPNPAHEQVRLNLTAPAASPLHVRVLNALGQLVWQETSVVAAGPVSLTVPVRGWAPGLYHVQVQCGARVSTQRLVVTP